MSSGETSVATVEKLWILRPVKAPDTSVRETFWYDCAHGFVVRAPSAKVARELAADACGDEGRAVWKDPTVTSCRHLNERGEPGVVLCDFLHG